MGNQQSIPERGLIYKKLDKDRNEVRLLKFQKRRLRNPQRLNVSLYTVSLSENPSYHCLSYVWGDPNLTWPIYVDGVLIHITPNLGAALTQLEHEEMEALWVDGICINQGDMDERVDQVKKMSEIYSGCVANFAWLGSGDKKSYRAMHAINTVGARWLRNLLVAYLDNVINHSGEEIEDPPDLPAFVELREALRSDGDSNTRDPFTFDSVFDSVPRSCIAIILDAVDILIEESSYNRMRDELIPPLNADFDKAASAWRHIMDRPLWRRIWIVQEMVLPKLVILKCGSKSAKLDYLHAIYEFTRGAMFTPQQKAVGTKISELYECFTSSENSLSFIATRRQSMFSTRNSAQSWDTIHVMLQQCGLLRSTDPLDKVYGLMSISSDMEGLRDLVSYNKSPIQLISEVMKLTLLRHGMRHIQEGQWFQYPDYPWFGFPDDPRLPSPYPIAGTSPFWPSWVNIGEAIYPSYPVFGPLYLLHKGRAEIKVKQFEASKSYRCKLSLLNFPRPDTLRIPCRIIGNVERVCDLSIRTWLQDEDDFEVAQMAMARSIISETEHFFGLEKDLNCALHGKPLWWLFSLQTDVPSNPEFLQSWRKNMEEYKKQFFVLKEGGVDPTNCLFHRTAIIQWLEAYSPFTIGTGYIGIGPRQMEADDKVVIFPDVDVPYVLRPVGNGCYKILGQSYVLGIMHGEFLEHYPPEMMVDLL
ncbi:heterokaryon incompatibility protein-domain-containing protein [Leptodontidium sp. MPI-SDFR-AT-0119]|nr:heterokaryon incompatibility protein-domain-containing protein [Leptodontidium sp. MPI-SDFR-AT-0119]